jgi:hypothetical protein
VAAHLPDLSLQRCLLTHPSKPALCADELRTDAGVSVEGSTIRACTIDGAMRMNGARIGGQLDCSGATSSNPSGLALHGERLHVDGARSSFAGLPMGQTAHRSKSPERLFRCKSVNRIRSMSPCTCPSSCSVSR